MNRVSLFEKALKQISTCDPETIEGRKLLKQACTIAIQEFLKIELQKDVQKLSSVN